MSRKGFPGETKKADMARRDFSGETNKADTAGRDFPGETKKADIAGRDFPGETNKADTAGRDFSGETNEADMTGRDFPGETNKADMTGEDFPGEMSKADIAGRDFPGETNKADTAGRDFPGEMKKADMDTENFVKEKSKKEPGERILVFGGTIEGRQVSEYLTGRGVFHTLCVATEYGEEVLEPGRYLTVRRGRMNEDEMQAFLRENSFRAVVDATHPYAVEVSKNVREACKKTGLLYLRYLRPGIGVEDTGSQNRIIREDTENQNRFEGEDTENQNRFDEEDTENQNSFGVEDMEKRDGSSAGAGLRDGCVYVDSARKAAEYLESRSGKIFLTTGSKELSVFTETISDRSRIFARVLPSAAVIESCRSLGLEGKQICGMQGPFSRELNEAMLRQAGASFLVTKDTGKSGGFPEKLEAAQSLGVSVVIIRRPEETGYSWEELKQALGDIVQNEARVEAEPVRQNEAGGEAEQARQDGTGSEAEPVRQNEARVEAEQARQDGTGGEAEQIQQSEARCEAEQARQCESAGGYETAILQGGCQEDAARQSGIPEKFGPGIRQLSCVGIGMGTYSTLTQEAAQVIRDADILFGARRILESVEEMMGWRRDALKPGPDCRAAVCEPECESPKEALKPGASWETKYESQNEVPAALAAPETPGPKPVMVPEYSGEKIAAYLNAHPQYRRAAILMSGDVGFYSGARGIGDAFPGEQVKYYCGISSVVYFASRIPTAWQDAKLVSAHGKQINILNYVKRYPKIILLVSGREDVEQICRELCRAGMNRAQVTVGTNLSYPEETVTKGTPEDFLSCKTTGLHIMMVENPEAGHIVTPGIPDEAFVRGKVPMTKEEIRILSVAKLRLTEDAVVYDVGAGTGSVSMEIARLATSGRVYAVEKNPEGIELIRENSRRLGLSNVAAVEGMAPEALEELPTPTHAFIGGTSGNMREITALLLKKNPNIRITINTIALESIGEVMAVLKELGIEDADIVQISAARSRTLGRYHMMNGLNPVYIVSFGGRAKAGTGALEAF